jgi:hypothetical protein
LLFLAYDLLFFLLKTARVIMTLSSDELAILEYLKSWNGKSITLIEIARNAAGRQKFRDTPEWANGLMYRLVEAKFVEVNERGHYNIAEGASVPRQQKTPAPAVTPKPPKTAEIVGDNYFPANPEPLEPLPPRWVSPQIEAILKQSGKMTPGHKKG